MKVGVFGGTFDPFHLGHRSMVEAAMSQGGLDRLIVIPSARPPHKDPAGVTPCSYRLAMAMEALADLPDVEVSDREARRPGPSYMVDTLSDLRMEYRDEDGVEPDLWLIAGSDVLSDLPRWRSPGRILELAGLLVAARPGEDEPSVRSAADSLLARFPTLRLSRFAIRPVFVSASDIRSRLAARGGSPFRPHDGQEGDGVDIGNPGDPGDERNPGDMDDIGAAGLSEPVLAFIRRHALYYGDEPLYGLDQALRNRIDELERKLAGLFRGGRLLHSLDTLRMALALDRAFPNPDRSRTALAEAAIVHDCAKHLAPRDARRLARMHLPDLSDQVLSDPDLLHAPLGAVVARTEFGITDPAILRAVSLHTTGAAAMSDLELLVFLADKSEPSRQYPQAERIRRMALSDPRRAVRTCLEELVRHLGALGLPPHPDTLAGLEDLGRPPIHLSTDPDPEIQEGREILT